MEEEYLKKIMTTIILITLIALSFFILKPILLSIILGFILAFIFSPIYDWFYKKTNSKNLTASLICFVLLLIILVSFYFLVPILVQQSFKIFMTSQQIDFITPIKRLFPSIFASEEFASQIGSVISSFITKATNFFMNSFSDIILNLPTLSLQFLVVAFTFFFVLRDKELLIDYIKSLLPFSKEVEKKLFDYTKSITASVLYGQIIVGILQGIIAGTGFFIFGVPNALLLTLLAIFGGILPMIWTVIIWVPVAIYLLVAGNNVAALGVISFGLVSSSIDNFLRPWIISRRARLHSALVLIGMVGGLFLFGVLGLILGPLVLAYLLIVLEIYRGKRTPGLIIQEGKKS